MDTDLLATRPLEREAAQRLAVCWRVLGGLLQGPITEDVLATVRSPDLLREWPVPGGSRTDEGLRAWAESSRAGEDAALVEADRRRLIVGPGRVPASPYESVHRSAEGLLFEAETLQVREWYRRYGLRTARLNRDPDDHVCLELEFLATLLARALAGWDSDEPGVAEDLVRAHDAFVAEHPAQWFPQLFAILENQARTHFLRGIAILGQDVVARLAAD